MDRKEIVAAAGAYWDANRDAIVADIAKLVEIPSTEDLAASAPGAPYGPGPAAALAKALEDKPYPVFPIGDCVKPGKVYDAVHGGFHALRKLG